MAFACEDARASGVSPRRLRARDLEKPYRGVRLIIDPASEPDDTAPGAIDRRLRRSLMKLIAGYECVRHPSSFYTGSTALGIHRLPFLADESAALCVGVLLPARAPRMDGVRGVAFSPWLATVGTYEGLPVTTPASTWALLAREFSEPKLTMLADAIVRIPRGKGGQPQPLRQLATLDQLRVAAMAPHRRHREKLLQSLERARVGSMSVLESEYRLAADDARLPEPELDVEIRDRDGRLVGIADLVYREHRTLVEIEGDQHRTSREQWNRDLEKYAAYTAMGWEVVRVTSSHIRGSGRGVDLVRTALNRRSP